LYFCDHSDDLRGLKSSSYPFFRNLSKATDGYSTGVKRSGDNAVLNTNENVLVQDAVATQATAPNKIFRNLRSRRRLPRLLRPPPPS